MLESQGTQNRVKAAKWGKPKSQAPGQTIRSLVVLLEMEPELKQQVPGTKLAAHGAGN